MKRSGRFLAIALVMMLAFVLAVTSAACAAEKKGTFKIGAYLPLSGGNAAYGIESRKAIDMAVKMINEQGGFNGANVVFLPYDSQSSPEEAVKVVNRLIEVEGINACIGSILSGEIMATGKTLNDEKILTYGLGTSPSFMAQNWPYIFRATMNSAFAMGLEADMLVKLGMTRVATFSGLDDSSVATQASFAAECKARGVEVVAAESHDTGDTDYSAQIARLIASNPHCIWFATMGEVSPIFVKQLRQYGYTGFIMDKEAFAVSMIDIAGKQNSTYIMFANPYVTYNNSDECDIPIMKKFLDMYHAEYGEYSQTECAYRAWDSLMAMWEAAKLAGSNDPEALRAAANKVKIDSLGGTLDYTGGDREGYHVFNTFMMVDGRSMLFDDWVKSGGYDAYKKATGNAH